MKRLGIKNPKELLRNRAGIQKGNLRAYLLHHQSHLQKEIDHTHSQLATMKYQLQLTYKHFLSVS